MTREDFLNERAAGVLVHPTSLPGPGIGDLGPAAFEFVRWLGEAGQRFWQILPLVPVDGGGSPYNGLSAMAGNPLLISPEWLVREGLLDPGDISAAPSSGRIGFDAIERWKDSLHRAAFARFRRDGRGTLDAGLRAFRERNRSWLEDFALFRALRENFGGASWVSWPEPIRRRDSDAILDWQRVLADEVEYHGFLQYVFDAQWRTLRDFAGRHGVAVIGDIPIFVAHDSADVWAHPEYFQLRPDGMPEVVAGVPPDYFSPTGQRWGNPLYRWEVLAQSGYGWWIDRFRRAFDLVDVVRIDHFRGFESNWEIEAREATAIHGRWVAGPGQALFRRLEAVLGPVPLIAEDLGIITREVERLRDDLGLPGMRVLQFAFDGDPRNPHLPRNYERATVAYTGTHDNDTVAGWWATRSPEERRTVRETLGDRSLEPWDFIAAVLASPARVAIVPIQDILGLGSEARMNTPGEAARNWAWKMSEAVPREAADRLRRLTSETGRIVPGTNVPTDRYPGSEG